MSFCSASIGNDLAVLDQERCEMVHGSHPLVSPLPSPLSPPTRTSVAVGLWYAPGRTVSSSWVDTVTGTYDANHHRWLRFTAVPVIVVDMNTWGEFAILDPTFCSPERPCCTSTASASASWGRQERTVVPECILCARF